MTGHAGRHCVVDSIVIKKGGYETYRAVASIAFTGCGYMTFMLANCNYAIVTTLARAGNAGMVIAAIGFQFQEAGCVVAIVTFQFSCHVPFRFTNGGHAIMAVAAITENFSVIRK